MRQLAVLVAWSVLSAACGASVPPSVTHTATAASRSIRPSPTLVVFTQGRVEIGDDYFAPDEINVRVGATVTWQIASGENNHDVVSNDGLFRSNSPMTRGVDVFTFTFLTPGEYRYVCSYHIPQGMIGKVIVK